jgi:hypothetical protein
MVFVVAVLVWVPFQAVLGQTGAKVELRIIKPMMNLAFTEFYCINEDDNLAYGVFQKTAYPLGMEAELLSMELYDMRQIPRQLEWRRPTPDDPIAPSTPSTDNNMEILIEHGCDTEFMVQTVHRSPLTDNELLMTWGPFNVQMDYAPPS